MRTLALLMLVLPAWLHAQQDTTQTVQEVTVTASRNALFLQDVPRSTVALTAAQLKTLPAVSINDAFGYVPGVDVRERGPFGVQADLALRGGTFNQTLVLLSGLKLSDPMTGHHNLNLPIPVQAIGTVEILKGPAGRTLGQNALAGAINISPATHLAPTLTLTYGQHNLSYANFTTGLAAARSRHVLSAGYTYSDGYTQNTDFGISQAFYHGQFTATDSITLTATAGYSARHFGAANFYFTPSREYETTESWLTAIGLRTSRTQLNLYWRRHFDDYRPFREQQQTPRNKHHADGISLDGNHSFRALGGNTALGFDLKNEQIRSNNLGSHYRWTGGLYVEQIWQMGRWSFSPGAYLNYFSDFGWAAYPGLDLSFRPSTQWKLYATTGRAYRIPTYVDLYLNTSQNKGNPDLDPESAWTYELGGQWQHHGWQIEAALFQRDGYNLIDYARADTATSGPFNARNVNDLTTRGLEAGISRRFEQLFVHTLSLHYTYLEQNNDPGSYTSRYVFDFLRHQLVASAELWLLGEHLGARPLFRYEKRVARRENYLLDLRINYRLRRWTLFVEGTNLLNRPYTDIGGAVLPGRWLRGGLQVQLGDEPIRLGQVAR